MASADAAAAEADADLAELEAAIGHAFADREFLEQALTHPSMTGTAGGAGGRGRAFERLEFLGDRVLGLAVAEWLVERHPDEREGPLAKRLAAVVRREALCVVALRIALGRHLRLSPGEDETGGRRNATVLADAVEAVIGAVHLDAGLPAARAVVRRLFAEAVEAAATPPVDAKTALQEWAQGRRRPHPTYALVGRSGPPHEPVFEVAVAIDGMEPATGSGRSKREAERAAAEAMLAREGVRHG